MLMFGKSVKQGADSIVFCAAGRDLDHLRGKFVRNRKIETKIERILSSNSICSSELWNKTLNFVEK